MVAGYASLPRVRAGFELEPVQYAARGTPAFRRIREVLELSEAFGRLLTHPRVLDLLHDPLGPRVELWRELLMMKPARVGREKPWHQDSTYWPWRPMRLVSVMTAIDTTMPRNGCLQVIAGSHQAVLPHHAGRKRLDLTEEQQAGTLHIPLESGDMLVFHSLLLHASEPNRSEQDRRVQAYKFAFVHNPWDKVVSQCEFRVRTHQNRMGEQLTRDFAGICRELDIAPELRHLNRTRGANALPRMLRRRNRRAGRAPVSRRHRALRVQVRCGAWVAPRPCSPLCSSPPRARRPSLAPPRSRSPSFACPSTFAST